MFHRVQTSPREQNADVKPSVAETSAQKTARVSSRMTTPPATPTPPADKPFVKSQASSGKAQSYLQPTGSSAKSVDAVKAEENFSAPEERALKPTPKTETTTQTQQKEKDTETMPENSSMASQATSYQSQEKTAEAKAPVTSIYTAERAAPTSSGYAPSYSSPYAKQTAATPASDAYASSDRKLTIGRGITMSGEIESCDHLYVEGTVEAALKGADVLDIAESGIFYGTVDIENANISGRFEGDLTVKGRLVVEATGVVTGSITYGELQIESGAIIDGRLTPMASAAVATIETPVETSAAPAQKEEVQEVAQAEAPKQATPQSKSLFEKQSVVPAE